MPGNEANGTIDILFCREYIYITTTCRIKKRRAAARALAPLASALQKKAVFCRKLYKKNTISYLNYYEIITKIRENP